MLLYLPILRFRCLDRVALAMKKLKKIVINTVICIFWRLLGVQIFLVRPAAESAVKTRRMKFETIDSSLP